MPELVGGEATELEFLEHRAATGRLLVAETRAVPAHIAGFAFWTPEDGFAYLEEIDVALAAGRMGAGSALLRAFEQSASQEGFTFASLTTFRDVPWNGPWYAKHGYVEWPQARGLPGHAARWDHQMDEGLDMRRRIFMRKKIA